MRWFNNLKIAKKLITSFTIVSLFIGIVGFLGISNMKKINNGSVSMYQVDLIGVKDMSEIKSNILKVNSNTFLSLYSKDKNKLEALLSENNQLKEQDDKILASYEKTITTEEDKNLYSQLNKLLQDYRSNRETLSKAMLENKYDEALIVFDKSTETTNKIVDLLNKYVDFNTNLAQKHYEQNNNIYKASLITVIIIIILGFLIAISIGLTIAKIISKQVNKIVDFAKALGQGDLTHTIHIDSKDEIGVLSTELNKANNGMKELISEIMENSTDISATSEELSATAEEISASMLAVNEATEQIAKGTQDLSAITEEVNASTEEISSNTSELSNKASNSTIAVEEIKQRAKNIKIQAKESIENGELIYNEKQENIMKAIEDGKVVNGIKSMAEVIANIASQTKMLSLNASIESARAGEHGKGFAVVANEVGKLAEKSSETVNQIQDVIHKVEFAFDNLSKSGKDVLTFMAENVKPNYELLLATGIQYEKDSELINTMAKEISVSSKLMSETIGQVSIAVESVSATSEETASSSQEILSSINEITVAINDVAKSAQNQAELSQKLNEMIQKFKI